MNPGEWRKVFIALERSRCPRYVWKAVYQEYLRSDAWKQLRAFMIKYYEGRCANCYKETALQVHHKTYDRVGDEEYCDLWPLCEECHMLEHGLIQPTRWFDELMDKLFGHPNHPPGPKPWQRQSDTAPGEPA